MVCVLLRSFYSLKTGYCTSSCNQIGVLHWQKNSDVHDGCIIPKQSQITTLHGM
jgi:hypothetical protein